jgi:hypothetical protein
MDTSIKDIEKLHKNGSDIVVRGGQVLTNKIKEPSNRDVEVMDGQVNIYEVLI